MGRIDDLILLEQAGELPADMQKDLDLLRSAGEAPPKTTATESATFTKTATPAYDPAFSHVLSKEFFGGASDVATGISNALSMPQVDKASQNALGVAQTGLGILRMLSSPIGATGSQLGESTGEAARQVSYAAIGLAPEGSELRRIQPEASAAIGTAVGAPINVATQLIGAPALIERALPVAMSLVQKGAKMLPGAQVALREIGKKAVARLPSILKPARSANELFEELRGMGSPSIALPEFNKIAKAIASKEGTLDPFGLAKGGIEAVASKSAAATEQPVSQMYQALGLPQPEVKVPFQTIQTIRERLGGLVHEARLTGGVELGSWKRMYRGLSEDLEKATAEGVGPTYAKLKEANKAANREFAIGELDDIFNATMGLAREGATFTSSNFAQALNKIRKLRRDDELFAKGLGDVHLDRIERQLDELRKLKVLPPASGVNAGSRTTLAGGGAMASIGTGIGYLLGGPPGATYGGAIGGTIGFGGPFIISRILQGPKASKALTDLLKRTGEVSPQNLAALIALSKTEGIDDDTGFRSIMKTAETDIKTKIAAAIERYNLQREKTMAEEILKH